MTCIVTEETGLRCIREPRARFIGPPICFWHNVTLLLIAAGL